MWRKSERISIFDTWLIEIDDACRWWGENSFGCRLSRVVCRRMKMWCATISTSKWTVELFSFISTFVTSGRKKYNKNCVWEFHQILVLSSWVKNLSQQNNYSEGKLTQIFREYLTRHAFDKKNIFSITIYW